VRLFLLTALLVCSSARATFDQPAPGEISVRDLPGCSDRSWQEARAIIDAPAERVHRWLTDFENWPLLYPDVQAVEVIGRSGDETILRVHYRSYGNRVFTIHARITADGIYSSSHDHDIVASNRIFVTPVGAGRTDVIMQSSARVTGLLGAFVGRSMVRERQREKLVSDLRSLARLAHGRSAAR
jgi:hypothetical protein